MSNGRESQREAAGFPEPRAKVTGQELAPQRGCPGELSHRAFAAVLKRAFTAESCPVRPLPLQPKPLTVLTLSKARSQLTGGWEASRRQASAPPP